MDFLTLASEVGLPIAGAKPSQRKAHRSSIRKARNRRRRPLTLPWPPPEHEATRQQPAWPPSQGLMPRSEGKKALSETRFKGNACSSNEIAELRALKR